MPKWAKFIIGILLLPACAGAAQALWMVLHNSGESDTFWIAMLGGAACWLVIYTLLPRPMWIYVLGHELTHALWTWLFWGSVKRIKVTSRGGHVITNKSNFLISLAPYFFPLYAAIVVVVFIIGHLVWNWRPYFVWFHLLLGAAYAFHLTLTWHTLQTRQTDITEHGRLFSAVIIFLGNILLLLIGLPLLTGRVGLLTSLSWWLECTAQILQRIGKTL